MFLRMLAVGGRSAQRELLRHGSTGHRSVSPTRTLIMAPAAGLASMGGGAKPGSGAGLNGHSQKHSMAQASHAGREESAPAPGADPAASATVRPHAASLPRLHTRLPGDSSKSQQAQRGKTQPHGVRGTTHAAPGSATAAAAAAQTLFTRASATPTAAPKPPNPTPVKPAVQILHTCGSAPRLFRTPAPTPADSGTSCAGLQRRHSSVIGESAAPGLVTAVRRAVTAGGAAGAVTAGAPGVTAAAASASAPAVPQHPDGHLPGLPSSPDIIKPHVTPIQPDERSMQPDERSNADHSTGFAAVQTLTPHSRGTHPGMQHATAAVAVAPYPNPLVDPAAAVTPFDIGSSLGAMPTRTLRFDSPLPTPGDPPAEPVGSTAGSTYTPTGPVLPGAGSHPAGGVSGAPGSTTNPAAGKVSSPPAMEPAPKLVVGVGCSPGPRLGPSPHHNRVASCTSWYTAVDGELMGVEDGGPESSGPLCPRSGGSGVSRGSAWSPAQQQGGSLDGLHAAACSPGPSPLGLPAVVSGTETGSSGAVRAGGSTDGVEAVQPEAASGSWERQGSSNEGEVDIGEPGDFVCSDHTHEPGAPCDMEQHDGPITAMPDASGAAAGSAGRQQLTPHLEGSDPEQPNGTDASAADDEQAVEEAGEGGHVNGDGAEGGPGAQAGLLAPVTVLETVFSAPLVHPGDCLQLSFGGISTLAYWRPCLPRRWPILGAPAQLSGYAEEEMAAECATWCTAALIRCVDDCCG